MSPIGIARAGTDQCRVVDVDFLPTDQLQIVAWLEDSAGHYVDTIYITQQTGTYGLGNRPGRFDFNSGPNWPYGRRETVFPVWAHRHGLTFPRLEFQDPNSDSELSHIAKHSSHEPHFCRPLLDSGTDKPQWDAGTCATPPFTDKGQFSPTGQTSLYPPRADITRDISSTPPVDSADVDMYAMLNPFDAVSQATPVGGMDAQMSWPIPGDLPAGNYVLFVEVAKEFDDNASYNATMYPAPAVHYGDYGEPYRGQPSVVYSVGFSINDTEVIADTQTYAGYGDPDGQDGTLRAPDNTITTDTPGSGGARLQLVSDGQAMYRVRVDAHAETDLIPPAAPEAIALESTDARTATFAFVAPGDDGMTGGRVRGYEIRVMTGGAMNEANFASATPISSTVVPVDPGQPQEVTVTDLLPQTDYMIGIRALDNWRDPSGVCETSGPLAVYAFTMPAVPVGSVDACFIATAAYGSLMANDVGLLRRFRDAVLRNSVLGELAVEGYYTFGPALAGLIGESDLLRAAARDLLAPLVARVKGMTP